MKNRRQFLRAVSLACVGGIFLPSCAKDVVSSRFYGIQLYTLRDLMKVDPMETIKKVRDIGYNSIEPYGFNGNFFGIDAKTFKKSITDLGMTMKATHASFTPENEDELIRVAKEIGLEYLIIPWIGSEKFETLESCKAVADELNRLGEKCKKLGIKLGYHNHDQEFVPCETGEIPYDILMENTKPSLVTFELDIYWIIKGGKQPIEYFKKYPKRFSLLHLKDMAPTGETEALGAGTIDFKSIMDNTEIAGVKYSFVEQEHYTTTPLQGIESSYNYLKNKLN